ncbi:MAG TPA: hypothetical protein VLJ59_11545 [Mycobacteriales bacterium]|nr:hypothetical protein [Mycobacteriales bacterium]
MATKWTILKADQGEYVRVAEEEPEAPLVTRESAVTHGWDRFTKVTNADGTLSLKTATGTYLSALGGGGSLVVATADTVSANEKFTPVWSGATVQLKAPNGRYVSAQGGAGDVIDAIRTEGSTWETFTVTDNADGTVSLATYGGQRVRAERGGARVVANSDELRDQQTFAVEPAGATSVHLWVDNRRDPRYVCADQNIKNQILANRQSAFGWETFGSGSPVAGQLNLRASDGQYVCADYDKGGLLYANRGSVGPWETFTQLAGYERPRPRTLLVYYNYPSLINNAAGDVGKAAGQFAYYGYVVLGAGLEKPGGDHDKTASIVAKTHDLSQGMTQFFGYVPLGPAGPGLPRYTMDQIRARVAAWKWMGVDGIFFDTFGFEFGNTRQRQNLAVDAVHTAGLTVVANAWNPDDVFDGALGDVHLDHRTSTSRRATSSSTTRKRRSAGTRTPPSGTTRPRRCGPTRTSTSSGSCRRPRPDLATTLPHSGTPGTPPCSMGTRPSAGANPATTGRTPPPTTVPGPT